MFGGRPTGIVVVVVAAIVVGVAMTAATAGTKGGHDFYLKGGRCLCFFCNSVPNGEDGAASIWCKIDLCRW